MFCPKCGVNNPNEGQFCRKCGCDLKLVSDAISGKLMVSGNDKIKKSKKKPTWEETLTLLFVSIAFFTISIFLAFQPMGAFWWFWLLIPAFATLAQGIGKIIELRQDQKDNIDTGSNGRVSLPESEGVNTLPPKYTDFVSDVIIPKRQPGDLVPASVVEGTTRNLEMDPEGETMSLPKTNKDR
jgi:hypothetical protein